MDKKRIITIVIMVLCLGIFFYNLIKNKSNIEASKEDFPTASYEPGSFKDQGEMWDYLHSHSFRLAAAADSDSAAVMTVRNFELYLNGQQFSERLEVSDFQHVAVGLSGFNMQGQRLRMVLQKDSARCVLVDMTNASDSRVYKVVK